MKYRADIDGLRSIAVLSVIFYHLGFTTIFGSGFTGVDIFFVISGYLITSIIYTEMVEERFSFLDFYERRVRRIFPIFLFVTLTTLVFAYYIDFYNMRNFLNSLFSTLIMGSNFYFWKDAGYFALPSNMKPLLHTWSLGIEEQFYIIFPPILLLLLSKNFSIFLTCPSGRQKNLTYFIKNTPLLLQLFIFWLISFVICITQSYSTTDTAFYLLPYRLWEFLTGSILAIYGLEKINSTTGPNFFWLSKLKSKLGSIFAFCSSEKRTAILGVIGLLLTLFSVTYLDILKQPFPSFVALFPCLGAALCIEAGKNQEGFLYKILSFSLLKNIGKISFSLYLWHWVVIVFTREIVFLDTFELTTNLALLCLGISFILSIASYFFIEQPIRKKSILKQRKTLFMAMFIMTACIALLGFTIKKVGTTQSADVEYYNSINQENSYAKLPPPPRDAPTSISTALAFFGEEGVEPTLFVIGDSHSLMFYAVLDKLAKEHKVAGLLSCPKIPSLFYTFDFDSESQVDTNAKTALEHTKTLSKYLSQYPIKSVFLALRWTYGMYGYSNNTRSHIYSPSVMQHYINPESGEVVTDSVLAVRLGIAATADFFHKTNAKIFIKRPTPEFSWQVPQRASKAIRYYSKISPEFRNRVSIPYSSYLDFHKETFQELESIAQEKNLEFIDFSEKICDEDNCYGTAPDGTRYYCDDDHFSIDGSMFFQEELLPFILAGKR